MKSRSDEIRNRRKDLTPYLFHFIKGDKNPNSILSKILAEECLKSDKGVICFTEAPLTSCRDMFDYMEQYRKPMYTKFGIGILRDLLFELGARNVIYGRSMKNLNQNPKILHGCESGDYQSLNLIFRILGMRSVL